MRPKFPALCAASLLLVAVAHCAHAQNGGRPAPLISSGHPSAESPSASSGARRMLSDDEPTGAVQDAPTTSRAQTMSLRDDSIEDQPASPETINGQTSNQPSRNSRESDLPTSNDRLWTSAPARAAGPASQPTAATPSSATQLGSAGPSSSATQSSRTTQRFRDSGAQAAPAQLPPMPPEAEPLRTAPTANGPSPTVSATTTAPRSVAQTAAGNHAPSGTSHLQSHIAQAQYTSTAKNVSEHEASRGAANAKTGNDEHRPLKPPSANDSNPDEKRSTGTVQMFVSVVSSLLIVVGLLLGAAWCYRKATPNLNGTLPKQALQVLGRTQLAPRQQLILVRFGSKLVLMSNLQGEVRTISEIIDPLEVDRISGMCESSQAGSISDSFRTVLHNIGRTG